jgi:choline dehydrogenase-like flavoprotein
MTRQSEQVDVLIVGAGVSASIFAAVLAKAGRKVVMLEAGKQRTNADLISSQVFARRNHWYGSQVSEKGKHPINFPMNAGQGTGGAGMHHDACWPRFHVEDFTMAHDHGVGLDWPIGYHDLRPYYDRVQREVGISGDAAAEVWRPPGEPYPLPPVIEFAQGRLLRRGFESLGMRVAPVPVAINTRPYNGRPACLYDGWCEAGCPIGALANPLATYLDEALRAGATIRHESTVTRILTDKKGGRALGAVYVDAQGQEHTQLASVTILAAFGIQNARLLLLSGGEAHKDGLSNRSGLVGKYIMSHLAALMQSLFDEPTECHLGITGGQLICQDDYRKDGRESAFGSYQWMIASSTKPNDIIGLANAKPGIFGPALHHFLKDAAQHYAGMVAMAEDLPVKTNDVRLSSSKDRFGIPIAEVTHTADDRSLALREYAAVQGMKIMKAAKPREVWSSSFVMHCMGGTVMGKSSADSVVNSYGQSHEIANLYIAGAGLFPTSAGVNPTFTISALSLRGAEHLAANWSSYA